MGTVGSTLVGSIVSRSVGRKRTSTPSDDLPPTTRKFAEHLASLIGDDSIRVAKAVGVSADAVRKWCRGDSLPHLEHWPRLAKAVGLKDWRELLPRLK
jgi:hypothetical protein